MGNNDILYDNRDINKDIYAREIETPWQIGMRSPKSISKGEAITEIFSIYYDVAHTITRATPNDPGDADTIDYDEERVYDHLRNRRPKNIWVTNDSPATGAGSGTLFVRVAHDTPTNFSPETPIYAQQFKVYHNVYHFRLRSPVLGLPYRVTEYEVGTLA